MPQIKPIISIENVVASATIDQRLDLKDIVKKFPDNEYHPDQFPALVFRLKTPKTTTLLFSTGKMVCTGGKTEKDVYRSVNNLHNMLEEKGLMIY